MNVPKLRFKEFNDEWQNICLKDVFEYYSTNSLSRDQLSDNGMIKNIHYGDIHRKFSTIVNVEKNVDTYIKDINYKNKYELCKNNDLIFADASEDYDGIGKAIELINVNCNTVSGLHTILARDYKNVFAPKFKGYYFNSPKVHNQIRILANGFKVYGISKDTINKLEVNIPSINEQTKIANILELLDKKIELQTKKIEDLKLFKKGLIRSISNNIKASKKINDICIYENGTGYENYVNSDGNYKLISLNSLDIEGNLKSNCKKILIENPDTLLKGDIVMVLSDVGHGDFLGISALIPRNNEYVLNQRMGLLRIKDNSDPNYIVNIINANQKKFKVLGQGSSQLNLSKEDILNVEIPYPEKEMQTYYSRIFDNLSKLIYLNEEMILRLIELKKGLMQNMFV